MQPGAKGIQRLEIIILEYNIIMDRNAAIFNINLMFSPWSDGHNQLGIWLMETNPRNTGKSWI